MLAPKASDLREARGIGVPVLTRAPSRGQGLALSGSGFVGGDNSGSHVRELNPLLKMGVVRAGISPFEFVTMFYDRAYQKWVSQSQFVAVQIGTPALATASTTYVNVNAGVPFVPWRDLDSAGLKAQARLIAYLVSDNASGVTTVAWAVQSINVGGVPGAPTVGDTVTNTGTTGAVKDSGWDNMPTLTLQDYLAFGILIKTGNAAHTAGVSGATLMVRWVSKDPGV